MMLLGTHRAIPGDDTPTRRHRVLGWCATAVLAAALVAMLATR
jgi:hypothetical protein